jgi:acyl-coenzyme A thioesterase PaaI-like protein
MGPAVFVTSDGRFYTTTISLTVNFIAPARPGPLIVEAQVIQIGKSIAFMEGKLIANDGTVLATASTTARLVEAAKALAKEPLRGEAALSAARSAVWR